MADLLAQAVLLLTAHLGKTSPGQPKPLGPAEYGRFAQWLRDRGLNPQSLLLEDPSRVLADWVDSRITLDRIQYLLGRAAALGLALEKWERAGLWVITRGDADYPERLKKLLKAESPPVLFGSGSRSLLNAGGVAVVGSRDATEAELTFAAHLGGMAAQEGVCLVSGGAGGIDESAMIGALSSDGVAVGIVADHLLRSATSTKYRAALMAERLALVSPFNPEAGFDVGNAMARNRYIYCLADAAVVVATSEGTGGTWNGAIQNLKQGWVPLWAKSNPEDGSGTSALVARGGHWLPERFRLSDLSLKLAVPGGSEAVGSVPALGMAPLPRETPDGVPGTVEAGAALDLVQVKEDASRARSLEPNDLDFYSLFLMRVEALAGVAPVTSEQLSKALNIHKSQLNMWLNRALGEGRLTKLNKPLRYFWTNAPATQPPLFNKET
jgi:predicted Rossmann fold nucleotide-binding protein DprA/Smf involved in DNA uptake